MRSYWRDVIPDRRPNITSYRYRLSFYAFGPSSSLSLLIVRLILRPIFVLIDPPHLATFVKDVSRPVRMSTLVLGGSLCVSLFHIRSNTTLWFNFILVTKLSFRLE